MRSQLKDSRRLIDLTVIGLGYIPISSAADGVGVFSDGTPFGFHRTATGQVDIFFDPRLRPISASINCTNTTSYGGAYLFAPGQFRCVITTNAGVESNFDFTLSVTMIDNRS